VQAQALHRTAERLFRAAANGAGRQRMRADTTLRPAKPPRCFILSTGEDIPLGMSLRARMLIVEMEPNSIKFDQLTRCQSDAASGLYAQAMAGFIQWLTPQMGQINREWKIELAEIRQQATKSNMHRRTPENIASLMIGWRYFLRFAHEKGVIDESEHDAFCQETWEVLGHVASKQLSHQASSEPTARFLDLLRDSLASGKTYLKSLVSVVDMVPTERYGVCVGWDVPESSLIYLLPEASYAAAQEIGRQTGDPLTVSAQTLRKRLNEQGHIAETEGSQETLAVRKTIEGERIRVIVVYRTSLFAEPVQPVQPVQSPDEGSKEASIGQVFDSNWTGFDGDWAGWTGCKTTSVHSKPLIDNAMRYSGQVGQENVERERSDTRTTSDICPGAGQVLSDPSTNLSTKPVQSGKTLDESGLGYEEVF